jgi:hypothetical protein
MWASNNTAGDGVDVNLNLDSSNTIPVLGTALAGISTRGSFALESTRGVMANIAAGQASPIVFADWFEVTDLLVGLTVGQLFSIYVGFNAAIGGTATVGPVAGSIASLLVLC